METNTMFPAAVGCFSTCGPQAVRNTALRHGQQQVLSALGQLESRVSASMTSVRDRCATENLTGPI